MEKNEVLIKVDGVSKKFCRNLKRSLWYGVSDIMRGMVGSKANGELRNDEFWAVKDVSFEVRRGECLGLIGHNGAGKSTLLKMLNGLIRPDAGCIEMHGRIGALIELGAGFNSLLTGRENVYNNGAVLGFTKEEIDRKFDEIVAFAELEEFIDMPVQSYSSGMKVRLGFSVAAQMEPDVLIIDEVLAVGDIGFQIKCYNKLNELIRNTAVIFVSHNVQQVARLCSQIFHLNHGEVKFITDNIYEGIEHYLDEFKSISGMKESIINDQISVSKISINGFTNSMPVSITYGDFIEVKLSLFSTTYLNNISIGVAVNDRSLRPVAFFVSDLLSVDIEGRIIQFTSDPIYLNKGTYLLTLIVTRFENPGQNDRREILIRLDDYFSIKVNDNSKMQLPGSYFIKGEWQIEMNQKN